MRNRIAALIGVVVALSLVASTGCVSKKAYNQEQGASEARVDALEGAVEANQRRLNDMKLETDAMFIEVDGRAISAEKTGQAALSKANVANQNAEKAAKGKLLWTVTLTDDNVKFSLGQAEIGGNSKKVLDGMIQKMKGYNRAVFIEIEGHTDSSGGEAFNMKLGAKRAMGVRDYLWKKGGIPLHAMNTVSHGESEPVADNSTREGRAQNRRVVVRVLE